MRPAGRRVREATASVATSVAVRDRSHGKDTVWSRGCVRFSLVMISALMPALWTACPGKRTGRSQSPEPGSATERKAAGAQRESAERKGREERGAREERKAKAERKHEARPARSRAASDPIPIIPGGPREVEVKGNLGSKPVTLAIGELVSLTVGKMAVMYGFRGEERIAFTWDGHVCTVNGKVVGLDLEKLDAARAVELINKHHDTLESFNWDPERPLASEVERALVGVASKRLVLHLVGRTAAGTLFDLLDKLKGRVYGLILMVGDLSDARMKHVAGLGSLVVFHLEDGVVTDKGVALLAGLRSIALAECKNITKAGVSKLQRALPKTEIDADVKDDEDWRAKGRKPSASDRAGGHRSVEIPFACQGGDDA